MSNLDAANREILRHSTVQRRRELERRRVLAPIHAIDGLIAELEELHLLGRKRVPESWDRRLAELMATLPAAIGAPEMRARITIVHLMDELYDIQDALLRQKAGISDTDDLSQAS